MSPSTMQRLLKNDLQLKAYKITIRQLLSVATKKKRLERAKLLLKKLLDDTQPTILWTDEKLFTIQAIHNPQNNRIWTKNKESVTVELRTSFRRQKPASVMVWAGVTSNGLTTPLIFVEDGVKVNQHVYLDILKYRVLPWINSLPGNQAVTLKQDGATAHIAKMVQAQCKDNFKSFWSEKLWPPSFPDLNPMDFGIWSILERKACTVSHSNVEKLKKKLKESWANIESEIIRATCDQVIFRLHRAIIEKGGYIE